MKELLGLALAFLSPILYFVVATNFAMYQRWPVVHFLVGFFACGLLAYQVTRRQSWRRLLAAVVFLLALVPTAAFVWYTLDFSTYASTDPGFAVGAEFGDQLEGLAFASSTGAEASLLRRGQDPATLFVFYRGHW